MSSNVKKNYLYSVLYQILTIIIPLITTPYLSRVLGAERVGIYSFTNSIVQYFILISMMGILDYGNRTIAALKSKEERGIVFEEIYLIQFSTSMIALLIYIIYIFSGLASYRIISIIQCVLLIASLLDINWFFFGIEKFKLTVSRNMIIKLCSLIFIFLFVKNQDDLWKYVLIMSGSTFSSNLILWFFLRKEIVLSKIDIKKALRHLKPCLILMLPLLSRSIFVYLDKTMLGLMSGMKETGYYEYSEKIVLMVTSILTPLGTVMLPRISKLLSEGKEEEAQRYTALSMDFVVCLGIAFTAGIMAVSDLVYLFLGEEYISCGPIVNMMALTVIMVGWTNVIRTQYILPYKKDKVYMIAVFLGAVVDFVINYLLIPKLGAFGAAIGWVAAEVVITTTQTVYSKRKLPVSAYIKNELGFVVNAIIMYFSVSFLIRTLGESVFSFIIGVMAGVLIYGGLTLGYLYLFRKDLWEMLCNYLNNMLKKIKMKK